MKIDFTIIVYLSSVSHICVMHTFALLIGLLSVFGFNELL